MAMTSRQIQGDIYRMLKGSLLAGSISGEVYREGYRPRDSRSEDAIVIFTTGTAGEVQSGVVTVNIYVPDIDPYDNGTWLEDGERTSEIELLAQQWVDGLTCDKSRYRFRLRQTIYTAEEPEIRQHFVVVKLGYDYL